MSMNEKVICYNREIEKLFLAWISKGELGIINHNADGFIKDGIIKPHIWFQSECRPLFLLKEAYNGNGSKDSWDLCEWIRSDVESVGKISTWMTISLWAKGIINTNAEALYHLPNEIEQRRLGISCLDNIAVVNLRKSGGQKASDHEILKQYVAFDKSELSHEIILIQPTVIICGGTFRYIKDIFGKSLIWLEDNPYIILNDVGIPVLDYYHPACRFPKVMKYYGLIGMYQQMLLENKKIQVHRSTQFKT